MATYPNLPLEASVPFVQSVFDPAYMQPLLVAAVFGMLQGPSQIPGIVQDSNGIAGLALEALAPLGGFPTPTPPTVSHPVWYGQIQGPRRVAIMFSPGGHFTPGT
jgi:hypothetical protein